MVWFHNKDNFYTRALFYGAGDGTSMYSRVILNEVKDLIEKR